MNSTIVAIAQGEGDVIGELLQRDATARAEGEAINSLMKRNRMTDPTQTPEKVADMSLRDFFAAKAMSGMIADPAFLEAVNVDTVQNGGIRAVKIARSAYVMADVMLAVRREKEDSYDADGNSPQTL